MLNFNAEVAGLRALQSNQLAIERHVTDDHYVRDFEPGAFVLGGSVGCVHVQITAAAPRWAAVAMTKDLVTNSLAVVNFRRPSQWISGKLRIQFWFTSPVGSTANFFIQINVDAARTGEVIPATNLLALSAAYAGPAVADTKMFSGSVYTTTSFGNDDEHFSLRIARLSTNASDTNLNTFHLMDAEVFHIPASAEGHVPAV